MLGLLRHLQVTQLEMVLDLTHMCAFTAVCSSALSGGA
jgi:hypothetical protein